MQGWLQILIYDHGLNKMYTRLIPIKIFTSTKKFLPVPDNIATIMHWAKVQKLCKFFARFKH